MSPSPSFLQDERWLAFKAAALRGFHRYANWLVSITWVRFAVIALIAIVLANKIDSALTWHYTTNGATAKQIAERKRVQQRLEKAAQKLEEALSKEEAAAERVLEGMDLDVHIDQSGVRVQSRGASAPSTPSEGVSINLPALKINIPADRATPPTPPSTMTPEQLAAMEARYKAHAEALQARVERIKAAGGDLENSLNTAHSLLEEMETPHERELRLGEFVVDLTVLLVVASALIKATYRGRLQAEHRAAQATETAEAEQLKRQVVEARMAAMQAQVEPHFLFNTLASIDHLIEFDPPRASKMQRNLIALLRASMPTMREANASGVRDLGREMAVIRPYLEILQMRMEERLQTELDVPEGLLSAEFPPMMIQGLVENAIKHGLEPKPEGGSLKVKAEVVHGKLSVTVADTGLGFGRGNTSGTGVGLANIRERLALLYGPRASITISENQPCGTSICITVPYRTRTTDQPEGA